MKKLITVTLLLAMLCFTSIPAMAGGEIEYCLANPQQCISQCQQNPQACQNFCMLNQGVCAAINQMASDNPCFSYGMEFNMFTNSCAETTYVQACKIGGIGNCDESNWDQFVPSYAIPTLATAFANSSYESAPPPPDVIASCMANGITSGQCDAMYNTRIISQSNTPYETTSLVVIISGMFASVALDFFLPPAGVAWTAANAVTFFSWSGMSLVAFNLDVQDANIRAYQGCLDAAAANPNAGINCTYGNASLMWTNGSGF